MAAKLYAHLQDTSIKKSSWFTEESGKPFVVLVEVVIAFQEIPSNYRFSNLDIHCTENLPCHF